MAILGSRRGAAVALIFAPILYGEAHAQPGAGPRMPADRYVADEKGTCDNDKLAQLDALRGRTPASGFGYTFVLNPEAGLGRSSAARGESIQAPLERFEPVRLLAENRASGKLLVRSEQTRLCGWIDRQALLLPREFRDNKELIRVTPGTQPFLFGPAPLLVKEGPLKDEFPGNTLAMKVVVQNVNQKGEVRKIPVYEEPGSDRKPVDELSLFDIFEVFDARKVTQPANKRPGWYYLVGKRGAEGPGGLGRLYGWLHDEDVQTWNSRMAAFWSGRTQALGYGFDDHAQKAWKADRERRPPPVLPAFEGPLPGSQTTAPDEVAVRRFPIISQFPGFDEVQTTADVNWFKVAVRGLLACKPGSNGAAGDCISSEDIDAERMRWQTVIESMSRVDVLFVIDGTSSMNVYFRHVAEAVRIFTDKITANQDVNIGAVVYGDYRKGVANIDNVAFERVVRMHNPVTEPRLIEALLRFKKVEEDPGDTDLLEAPFAALIRAASTKWRPEAGLRIIVHIADHGNRAAGKTSEEYTASGQLKSTLKETVSAEMVARVLKERGIVYLPVAVAGAYNHTANERFRQQARDLDQRINLERADLAVTYDEASGMDREANRTTAVLAKLEDGITAARQAAKVTDARLRCARSKILEACAEVDAAKRSGSWTGRFAEKLSEELLPKNQIENILSRTETVTALHFPPVREAKDVFTYWLAIEPGDLANLTSISARLCDKFGQRSAANDFYDVIQAEIKASAGEYKTISDVYEKRFFIPAAFTLDFFRRTWDQLEADLGDDKGGYTKLQKQVCRTSFLLGRVLGGKRVNESTMSWNDKGFYEAAAEVDFQWKITPESGIALFYVPLTYFK